MNAQEQILFSVFLAIFVAVFAVQVVWGKNLGRRFWLGAAMGGCTMFMVLLALPNAGTTDVARFADAMGKSTSQRIAAKYQEMAHAHVAAADRR